MTPLIHTLLDEIWQSTEQRPAPCDRLTVSGTGALPSAFPSPNWLPPRSAAGLACAELLRREAAEAPQVWIDQRLASLWFGWTLRPLGWTLPAAQDAWPVTTRRQTAGYACIPMRRTIGGRWNRCWTRHRIKARWRRAC